ncbi:MAG: hypothetical protein ACOC1P_06745 [Minisyncoccales bacterium]
METEILKQRADKAIENFNEFINIEKDIVEKEHTLSDRIEDLKNLFNYVLEVVPEDMDRGRELNKKIKNEIVELCDVIMTDRLSDLDIEKEDELILRKLNRDVKNKRWKIVKKDFDDEKRIEGETIRLENSELKELRKRFLELIENIANSNLANQINSEKNGYFVKLFQFIKSYEKIINDLIKKEDLLIEND